MNKKKPAIGTCQLCKKENIVLTKAHLISKFQVKAACQSDNDSNIYTLNDKLVGSAPQNGWFDYILCENCNNVIVSDHEKIMSEFFNIHRNLFDSKIEDNVNILLQQRGLTPDDLYRHIKLAILSYFYQIEVAKIPYKREGKINFFKRPIPAGDLENIRQMILENDAGEETQYPVRISYAVPTKSISTTDERADVARDTEIVVAAITMDIFKLELFLTPGTNESDSSRLVFYDSLFKDILSVDSINKPLNYSAIHSIEMRNAILSSEDNDFIFRLFESGKNDTRELRNNSNHPINVLKNLASLSPEKSNTHYKIICECAFELLARDDSCDNRYTPFDFIKELMKLSVWRVLPQNTNVTLQSKKNYEKKESLTFEELESIRKEIIDNTLELLSSPFCNKAKKAAAFLIHCITFSDILGCRWTKKADETLDKLIEVLEQKILDKMVYKQIAEIMEGLLQNSSSIESKLAKVRDYVCKQDA